MQIKLDNPKIKNRRISERIVHRNRVLCVATIGGVVDWKFSLVELSRNLAKQLTKV